MSQQPGDKCRRYPPLLPCGLALLALVALVVGCSRRVAGVENDVPGPDPLVPYQQYLEKTSYDSPQISPDGRQIIVLGQSGGASNLMIAPVEQPTALRPLTHDQGRGFQSRTIWGERAFRWAEDSRHVLYLRDDKGDENWVLYAIDTVSGEVRRLSPAGGVRVRDLRISPKRPGEVLFSMNDRDPRVPEYYRADITTGALQHVAGVAPFQAKFFDQDFQERVGLKVNADLSWTFQMRRADGGWKTFLQLAPEDTTLMLSNFINGEEGGIFTPDGGKLISFSSQGLDTSALVDYDLKTGERHVLAVENGVDVKTALVDPVSAAPQAYVRHRTRTEWVLLDQSLAADFDYLGSLDDGELQVESRSRDDRRWVVSYMHTDYPTRYFLYDRSSRSAQPIGISSPQLAQMKLSKMVPMVIKSSDGFDLVSYLSYPTWVKLDAQGVPREPLPTITYVHGGPSDERAQLAFAPLVQWLNNRGYAFFYVNFRGSPGFGKAFMNAQRHEWGGAMNRDVIEQVQAIVKRGIADPKRIAIFGGSYGGYETLVAMTKTPGVFACGVDWVGPSNLETFIDPSTMPPDWHGEEWYRLLGDPRTEEGRQLLRDRSPINFADHTQGAMLIVQGANDVRVPVRESQQIVDQMDHHGTKVTFLLYPDEGHGLLRQENNASVMAITEVFFGQCLGGRHAPIGKALEGSSVQVPVGADRIPGLTEALAGRVDDGTLKVDPSIDAGSFGAFAGRYDLGGYELAVSQEQERLLVTIPGQGKHRLLPFEKDGFFLEDAPLKLRFRRGADGAVTAVAVISGGSESVAQRKAQ